MGQVELGRQVTVSHQALRAPLRSCDSGVVLLAQGELPTDRLRAAALSVCSWSACATKKRSLRIRAFPECRG
jgi:hypothetical protein